MLFQVKVCETYKAAEDDGIIHASTWKTEVEGGSDLGAGYDYTRTTKTWRTQANFKTDLCFKNVPNC